MKITLDCVCVDIRTFGLYFAIYNVSILFDFTLSTTFSPIEAFVRGSMCLVYHFFSLIAFAFPSGGASSLILFPN